MRRFPPSFQPSALDAHPASSWLFAMLVMLGAASAARADAAHGTPLQERLGVRLSGYVSLFTSSDQIDQLAFGRFGTLGDLSLTLTVLPWLTAEVGATGGAFLLSRDSPGFVTLQEHPRPNGGLLAPVGGMRIHTAHRQLSPFLALSAGPAFTGELVRPLLQGSVGLDIGLARGITLGPLLGYGRVIQKNGPEYTSDASYISVGITLAYRPLPPPKPPIIRTHTLERVHTHSVTQLPPSEPPPSDEDIDQLLKEALPSPAAERLELLAPVLFAFDSDALEPVGIAMLHEVASLLEQRTDIELLAILGFADSRGSSDYNLRLSQDRAERVRTWLIGHGIAQERLTVQVQGASGFVEAGENEAEHQQNRRVIFRVLRLKEGP